MAQSDVAICNIALQRLGASRIVSLTDNTAVGVQCNLCYEHIRDLLLRKHSWNFAVSRAVLPALSSSPSPEHANAFQLPADCLRILPPNDTYLDWVIEGRTILTNYAAPLYIRYIKRETDAIQYDPLFADALAAHIGVQIAGTLAEFTSKTTEMKEWLKTSLNEARRQNAFEQISQEQPEDTWLAVRRNGA